MAFLTDFYEQFNGKLGGRKKGRRKKENAQGTETMAALIDCEYNI